MITLTFNSSPIKGEEVYKSNDYQRVCKLNLLPLDACPATDGGDLFNRLNTNKSIK